MSFRVFIWTSFSISLMLSCNSRKEKQIQISDNQNVVYRDLLSDVFDSLEISDDVKGNVLVYLYLREDVTRDRSIQALKEYMRSDTAEVWRLPTLESLKSISKDSLIVEPDSINLRQGVLHFIPTSKIFARKEYFGTFNMTNIAFDDTKKLGCFYLALNCNDNCSRGVIIFVVPNGDRLKVEKIFHIWKG